MHKKRVLFIAALKTKKLNYDGERNKSTDVLNALIDTNKYDITVINLSLNKIIQIIKMIFCYLFSKYDYVFVSKCIVGGSKAIHILNKIKKNPNIYFYIIGNGYYGFDDKTIYFEDIKNCKELIVESTEVKESMILKDVTPEKMVIFPCLKPKFDIKMLEKTYEKEQPLNLLYFSRINPDKGLGDLIDALVKINSEFKKPIFNLDIAGGVSDEPGIDEFNKLVIEKCNKYSFLNYLGMTLRINGLDSYKRIQQYDLHVFPSRFKQECAPGSILDMFVAGVPTLSAKYPSYKTLLNENNSILFEQNNIKDLEEKLLYVYREGYIFLNNKRILSHKEYEKYTSDAFINVLKSIDFD